MPHFLYLNKQALQEPLRINDFSRDTEGFFLGLHKPIYSLLKKQVKDVFS